jgi:predicted dehydrogenase
MSDGPAEPTIRIGIIGVGQIGKHHVNEYNKIPGAKIVAVCDIRDDEANRVASLNNIPHVYHYFREMLQRDDLDAIDVCVHNNMHAPMTILALQAGKNVYCEKPMAGTYRDAENMYKVSLETGKKLSIQLSTLFSNEVRVAKYLIDAGKLGKLYHARSVGNRRRGRPYVDGYGSINFVNKDIAAGGALYDMGVYHIASLLYLLGNPEVISISGQTYQETDMDAARRELSHYSVEELGLGFVRMANSITLDIIEPWAIHLAINEGSAIVGSEGGVRIEPFGYFNNIGDVELDTKINLEQYAWRRSSIRENPDAEESPQKHWIAAQQGRVNLLPTAELALKTMLISEGIYMSTKVGHEVSAEEVRANSKSAVLEV